MHRQVDEAILIEVKLFATTQSAKTVHQTSA
jgi:hypothetical protein